MMFLTCLSKFFVSVLILVTMSFSFYAREAVLRMTLESLNEGVYGDVSADEVLRILSVKGRGSSGHSTRHTSHSSPQQTQSPFNNLDPNLVNGASHQTNGTALFSNGASGQSPFQFGNSASAFNTQATQASSGFNFNIGGPSIGNPFASTTPSHTAASGYSGSLFQLPSAPTPSHSAPSDNREKSTGDGEALWASNSPYHNQQNQANDATATNPFTGKASPAPQTTSNIFGQGFNQPSTSQAQSGATGSLFNAKPGFPSPLFGQQSQSSFSPFGGQQNQQQPTSNIFGHLNQNQSQAPSLAVDSDMNSPPQSEKAQKISFFGNNIQSTSSSGSFSFSSPSRTSQPVNNLFGSSFASKPTDNATRTTTSPSKDEKPLGTNLFGSSFASKPTATTAPSKDGKTLDTNLFGSSSTSIPATTASPSKGETALANNLFGSSFAPKPNTTSTPISKDIPAGDAPSLGDGAHSTVNEESNRHENSINNTPKFDLSHGRKMPTPSSAFKSQATTQSLGAETPSSKPPFTLLQPENPSQQTSLFQPTTSPSKSEASSLFSFSKPPSQLQVSSNAQDKSIFANINGTKALEKATETSSITGSGSTIFSTSDSGPSPNVSASNALSDSQTLSSPFTTSASNSTGQQSNNLLDSAVSSTSFPDAPISTMSESIPASKRRHWPTPEDLAEADRARDTVIRPNFPLDPHQRILKVVPKEYPPGLSESEKKQYLFDFRMRSLGYSYLIDLPKFKDLSKGSIYYNAMAEAIYFEYGQFKRVNPRGEFEHMTTKRVKNTDTPKDGPASKAPLFGFPTAEKRKAEDELTNDEGSGKRARASGELGSLIAEKRKAEEALSGGEEPGKRARARDVSYPTLPAEPQATPGSQTSKLFANVAGGNGATNSGPAQMPRGSLFSLGGSIPTSIQTSTQETQSSTTPAQPLKSIFEKTNPGTGSSLFQTNNTAMKLPESTWGNGSPSKPLFQLPGSSGLNESGSTSKFSFGNSSTNKPLFQLPDSSDGAGPGKPSTFTLPKFGSNASNGPQSTPSQASGPPSFGSVSGTDFMAQFEQAAKKTEESDKAKRKAEEYDSDEDDEAEWERKYEEEQRKKKQKVEETAKSENLKFKFGGPSPALSATSGDSVFSSSKAPISGVSTPNIFEHLSRAGSDAEGSKNGDADNEDEDEDVAEEGGSQGKGQDDTPNTGRSFFDRIEMDANGQPKREIPPEDEAEKKRQADLESLFPSKFRKGSGDIFSQPGSKGPTRSPSPAVSNSIFDQPSTAPKANNIFAFSAKEPNSGSLTNPAGDHASDQPSTTPKAGNIFGFPSKEQNSGSSTSPAGDHTWKPETPIKFGTSSTAPTFSITAPSPTKPTTEQKPASFGSLFGSAGDSNKSSLLTNPFAHLSNKPSPSAGFVFGGPSSTTGSSVFASANTSRATSPGGTTAEESNVDDGSDDAYAAAQEEQLDLSKSNAGEEHEELLFQVKAKAQEWASKSEGGEKGWTVRGVGELRLLKNKETNASRVVMRAGPTAKVILNAGLIAGLNYEIKGEKMVKFPIATSGGMQSWMLQVGKKEDAAKLAALLQENKSG